MRLRSSIVQRYIKDVEIKHIIGHDILVYAKTSFFYILILGGRYLLFKLFHIYISSIYLSWIFGIVAMGIYIKCIIDVLNEYLDCIIINNNGIIVFTWDGLLEYKTEIFGRSTIETVSDQQKGLLDIIFNRGNLTIKLDHGISFPFENIVNPKKVTNIILRTRQENNVLTIESPKSSGLPEEKFNVLVETLGEVIVDYMKNNDRDQRQY